MRLVLLVVAGAIAVGGAAVLLHGLFYVVLGSTFGDPGPVLVGVGMGKLAAGGLAIALGLGGLVLARELKRR